MRPLKHCRASFQHGWGSSQNQCKLWRFPFNNHSWNGRAIGWAFLQNCSGRSQHVSSQTRWVSSQNGSVLLKIYALSSQNRTASSQRRWGSSKLVGVPSKSVQCIRGLLPKSVGFLSELTRFFWMVRTDRSPKNFCVVCFFSKMERFLSKWKGFKHG